MEIMYAHSGLEGRQIKTPDVYWAVHHLITAE